MDLRAPRYRANIRPRRSDAIAKLRVIDLFPLLRLMRIFPAKPTERWPHQMRAPGSRDCGSAYFHSLWDLCRRATKPRPARWRMPARAPEANAKLAAAGG